MLGFKCNINDFWSNSLESFEYTSQTPFKGMRDNWHENYSTDGYLLQSFDNDLPIDHNKFYQALQVMPGTVAWTCLVPNTILPPHIDKFYLLSKKTGTLQEDCIRYVIFLEDWQFGQYVQLGDTSIIKWNKGDVWYFDWEVLHFAVNASNVNFHTCQVSTKK
jgi:hypothetical protein